MSSEKKVSARVALSNLKGNLVLAKAELLKARRTGVGEENAEKQVLVLEYAIAAVSTFKASGKSALKAAAKLATATTAIPTATAPVEDEGYGDEEGDSDF